MNISSVLGTHIRKVRKKCGLTIQKTAELADLSPEFLSDVERGRKEPSVSTVSKIADALGVKVSYLLKPIENKLQKRDTIEILYDEPTHELLTLLEGRSRYQIQTASRIVKTYFEEEDQRKN